MIHFQVAFPPGKELLNFCNGQQQCARISIAQSVIIYPYLEKFLSRRSPCLPMPAPPPKNESTSLAPPFPSASSCFRPGRPRGISKRPVREPMSVKTPFTGGSLVFWRGGYDALSTFESHAPKNPRRTSRAVEQQVIALRKAHPKWGKRSIANELTKRNNWTPLVSPDTVQRILKDTGLWPQEQKKSPSKGHQEKRTQQKSQDRVLMLTWPLCQQAMRPLRNYLLSVVHQGVW